MIIRSQNKIIESITRNINRRKWVILSGPAGIGKRWIIHEVIRNIGSKSDEDIIPVTLNFSEIKIASTWDLEKQIITKINQTLSIPVDTGKDLFTQVSGLLSGAGKSLLLFLMDFEVISNEGIRYMAAQLHRLFNHFTDNSGAFIVIMSGGFRLSLQGFHLLKNAVVIPIEEKTADEATNWANTDYPGISMDFVQRFHQATNGYPALFDALLKTWKDNRELNTPEEIIEKCLAGCLDADGKLLFAPFIRWFMNLDDHRFLSVIEGLLNDETIPVQHVKLAQDQIRYSGFFQDTEGRIEFRNEFVKLFFRKYVNSLRLADHYWLFSANNDKYWEKGCTLYRRLGKKGRVRREHAVIGPVYHNFSSLLTAAASFMSSKETRQEIFRILDNVLEYIFNIDEYFVCRSTGSGNDGFSIIYAPGRSEKFTGETQITDNDILELLETSLRLKGMWTNSWNYTYLAYSVIREETFSVILWIDNHENSITSEYNQYIAALATGMGLALLQAERKARSKNLENELELLNNVLENVDDYIQIINKDKKIMYLNKKSRDAIADESYKKEYIGHSCPELFISSRKCPEQCACLQVLTDHTAHRRVERWKDPLSLKALHMDVIDTPLFRGGEMVGVLQISRDITAFQNAFEAISDFAQNCTEREVFDTLLQKGIAGQGKIRARIFLPDKYIEFGKEEIVEISSYDCLGYEDDPAFIEEFRKGAFKIPRENFHYWYDDTLRVPVITRINEALTQGPHLNYENKYFKIMEVPLFYELYRKEFKKENTREWSSIGLFAGGKFFGLVVVDRYDKILRVMDCEILLGICKSAAAALYRISISSISEVVRVYRHTISQYLTALENYVWTFAENDLPKKDRVQFADQVEKLGEEFKNFNKNIYIMLPARQRYPINPQPVNIKQIIMDVITIFTYKARRQEVTISTEYTEPIPVINSDYKIIKLILFNMVDNAFTHLKQKEKHILIKTTGLDKQLKIDIIDTGTGISTDILPYIFDPGFSTKKYGTGIGLAASRDLANLINSRIEYDKNYKNGAKFVFTVKDLQEVPYGQNFNSRR